MEDAAGWVVIAEFRRRGDCRDPALVLDALNIPNRIADGPRHAALLLVPPDEAGRATAEIRQFQLENARRPAPLVLRLQGSGVAGVLGYALVIVLLFELQRRLGAGIDWLAAGGLDGAAVRSGEWWRVVTALTLHADAGHLLANLLFGAFFGVFAGQYLGSGLAWATILAAAALGNAFDVLLLPPAHRAIGASTAVFAALGLVSALTWRFHGQHAGSWARRYAPLIGGIALLAFIGTGDERTDVVAHLTGFVAGLGAGLAFSARQPAWPGSPVLQRGAGAGAVLGIAACWWLAVDAWRSGLT